MKLIKNCIPFTMYRWLIEKKNYNFSKIDDELIQRMARYKNIHNGERCFILGNGPSLLDVDLSLLSSEYTFSVNQLPRNKHFADLRTTYHMWSDSLFFEINGTKPEDIELLNVMKNVKSCDNNPIVFYELSAFNMIQKYKLYDDLNIEYFRAISMDFDIGLGNYVDFSYSIPNFPTVVHSAICLAVYMGFSEIYLLGCDCTGFVNIANNRLNQGNNVRYGYAVSEKERKRMEEKSNERRIADELSSYVELFNLYEKLTVYCQKQGVMLLNATDKSLIDSIPKVKLGEILNDNKEKRFNL